MLSNGIGTTFSWLNGPTRIFSMPQAAIATCSEEPGLCYFSYRFRCYSVLLGLVFIGLPLTAAN